MASIGVDELGARTREVLRRVREGGETIDVTDGDYIVARVVPVWTSHVDQRAEHRESPEEWLRRADELAREIGSQWPKGVSAVDAIRDVRREL